MTENSKPTQRDSTPNTSDITDYIISSPAVYLQNLTLNNDLSFDHSAIHCDFSTKIKNSIPLPINAKLTD